PGTYEIEMWHEGTVETPVYDGPKLTAVMYSAPIVETRTVTVEAGKQARVEIVFDARGGRPRGQRARRGRTGVSGRRCRDRRRRAGGLRAGRRPGGRGTRPRRSDRKAGEDARQEDAHVDKHLDARAGAGRVAAGDGGIGAAPRRQPARAR